MSGRIFLVGIGPGGPGSMTLDAHDALKQCDLVIGYGPYLKQVAPLIGGKETLALGMRQELERCGEAIRHARAGRVVALISSGDAGIYGMGGPLLEMLLADGWQPGASPEVTVIPGVTALSACAARVGAPLTHDFCAISLSDLLTPWAVIRQRLEAAARADFVTALYNPRSRHRTQQLEEARGIFLQHRNPATPVALVRDAYRPEEARLLTTLGELEVERADMNTTLLIGNSRTVIRQGVMVTPRGYADKYGPLDEALERE